MTSGGLRNPKGTPSECSLFIDNIGLQYTFAVCCAQDTGKTTNFWLRLWLAKFFTTAESATHTF